MKCPNCGSEHSVKNGKVNTHPHYKCKVNCFVPTKKGRISTRTKPNTIEY